MLYAEGICCVLRIFLEWFEIIMRCKILYSISQNTLFFNVTNVLNVIFILL
jgi:hypothetical protein